MNPQAVQLVSGNLFIKLIWNIDYSAADFFVMVIYIFQRESLQGKSGIHNLCRMSVRSAKINQSSFCN
ncbi:hypothetical protein D3C81_684910 [compost metagenome]